MCVCSKAMDKSTSTHSLGSSTKGPHSLTVSGSTNGSKHGHHSSPTGSPSIRHKVAHSPGITSLCKPIPVSSVLSFYELSACLPGGKMEHFDRYSGRVTLVVNMASCDKNTRQELHQLNDLVTLYGARGLVVMAFPCNQFGRLEPLDDAEIPLFLQNVRPGVKFEPKFSIFAKIQVNGGQTHPVYEYLRMKQPIPQDDDGQVCKDVSDIHWNPVTRSDVSWNYEKFLISHDGQPARRYSPKTGIDTLKKDIEALIRRIPKSVKESLQLQH